MASTLTPNMNLIVPGVGSEAGPTYAQDINNSLSVIDQHNHSPGSGVQITPSGFNINTALTFNNNSATNLSSIIFNPQSSAPTGNGTTYESAAGDIHFINGAGLDIQITNSSGVNVSPTSIPGLVSPASVEYVPGSETFVWQSDTNIAANMDFGAAIMRNLSPNSTFALTLQPPTSLASNQTITLPSPVPFTSFVVLDAGGLLAGTINVTNGITGDNIALNTILTGNIAPGTILGSNIAANTITESNIVAGTITNTSINSSANIALTKLAAPSIASTTVGTFSTASTSFVNAAAVNVTTTTRPVDISLHSLLGSIPGGYIEAFGTNAPTVYFQVVNAQTSAIINSGTLEMANVAGGFTLRIPLSTMSCIDTAPTSGTTQYVLKVAAASGCTVTISQLTMTVIAR